MVNFIMNVFSDMAIANQAQLQLNCLSCMCQNKWQAVQHYISNIKPLILAIVIQELI